MRKRRKVSACVSAALRSRVRACLDEAVERQQAEPEVLRALAGVHSPLHACWLLGHLLLALVPRPAVASPVGLAPTPAEAKATVSLDSRLALRLLVVSVYWLPLTLAIRSAVWLLRQMQLVVLQQILTLRRQ